MFLHVFMPFEEISARGLVFHGVDKHALLSSLELESPVSISFYYYFFHVFIFKVLSLDLIHASAQGSITLFEFIAPRGSAVWWKEKGLGVTLSVYESFPQLLFFVSTSVRR